MWIIFSILSAFFGAVMTILIKESLKDINPMLSLFIRTLLVVIILFIYIICTNNFKELKNISKTSYIKLFISAVVTFLTWIFSYLALKSTSAFKAASFDKLNIIFIFLISVIFLKEKISLLAIIGVLLMIFGTFLITL